MSARTSQRGTIVPVRDAAREALSSGSGEVRSWKMSPEELEDYRARTGYKAPTNQEGKEISQPVQDKSVRPGVFSSEEQSRRAKNGRPETVGPDKQAFLEGIAEGKTIAAMEKVFGMKPNAMYYWLKKWNLIGITPGKARVLLGVSDPAEDEADSSATEEPIVEGSVGSDESKEIISADTDAILKLTVEKRELQKRVVDYESELASWAQRDTESTVRILELEDDRSNWKQLSAIYKDERDTRELELIEAFQAIRELKDEQVLLLQTIEKAVTPEPVVLAGNDAVNHPSHYNAGGIECIDAIEAALTGLSGGQAYNTGAAIKYLWRWSHKNGVEDLRKAAWYVNRLIDGLESRQHG